MPKASKLRSDMPSSELNIAELMDSISETRKMWAQLTNPPVLEFARQATASFREAQSSWKAIADSPGVQISRQFAEQLGWDRSFIGSLGARPEWFTSTQTSYNAFKSDWEPIYNAQSLARDLLDSAVFRDSQSLARDLLDSPAFQAAQQMLGIYGSLKTSSMAEIAQNLAGQADWLRQMQFVPSPPLAAFSAGLAQAIESPTYREYFEESFAGQVFDRLNEAETASSPETKVQALHNLLLWLREQLDKLPPNRVILEKFIWLVFTFIIPVYSLVYDHQGAARDEAWQQQHSIETRAIADECRVQFELLSEQLTTQYQAIQALDVSQPEYGVTSLLHVRAEPSAKEKSLFRLTPGMTIVEIERQGNWLYVEYFNYIEWKQEQGWVYKRGLAPIPASPNEQ